MEKTNRIILLTDFSENSENLVDFAFNISEIIDAKLIFVHRIPGMVPALTDDESRTEFLNAEMQAAHLKLRKLARGRVLSNDSFHVTREPLLSKIHELANNDYIDWIFTGLKGTGPIRRLLIGSTTLKIIDESSLLTVAVPLQNQIAVPGKFMVGVTSRFSLNKNQLEKVLATLKVPNTQLEFFTILKTDEDETNARKYLSALKEMYGKYNPKIEIYKGDDAFQLLKNKVENSANSFLILQQGSRNLDDKLFRKFMINELVYEAQTPLIVLSA